MIAVRYDREDRARLLADHPDWQLLAERDAIVRAFFFPNFLPAIAFVQRIAVIAEAMDHHPEWSHAQGKVTIILTSHDAGGLSEADRLLAGAIDRIAAELFGAG